MEFSTFVFIVMCILIFGSIIATAIVHAAIEDIAESLEQLVHLIFLDLLDKKE